MIKFDNIGSDPEFLLHNGIEFVPSFMFINGTKEKPENVGNGFAILKDNLLIEGNIPPAIYRDQFIGNMEILKSLINDIVSIKGAKLVEEDIAEFNEDYIFTQDGLEFGCSNYLDAYTKKVISTPSLNDYKRPCGFHIHIGYTILDNTYRKNIIDRLISIAFDYFLTLPSDQIHFTEERRNNYGKYGSYRQCKYGVECRTLGGYFTQERYLGWIYDQVLKTIDYVANPDNHKKLNALKQANITNYELLGINMEEQIPVNIKNLISC